MPKQLPAKLTIDQIAKMFSFPSWEKLDDANLDYYHACAYSAVEDFSGSPDDREEAYHRAHDAARDQLFRAWYSAVFDAASREFSAHEILLVPLKLRGKVPACPYQYRLKPARSWSATAALLRMTINGVGYFHFPTLRDLLLSGPYTPREAALSHLGYISRRAEVFGDVSPRSAYDRSMDAFDR